jgi:periplasmic protein TonB
VYDPVARVLAERESMDAGFPGSVMLSLVAHLLLVGIAVAAPFVFPTAPVLKVMDGFMEPLPRGGGGSSAPAAPPASVPKAKPSEAPPEPVAAPVSKVVQPPKVEPRQGLPELDSKKPRRKTEDPVVARGPTTAIAGSPQSGSVRGATGASSTTPGLELAPPGVGVPDGTETGGDWYLAGVQQKIWMIWTQQIKTGFTQPVGVTFTILADGSIADLRVSQPSGATMIDIAAQRAVTSAGPFGPLPKNYGTNQKTIQAVFKPTP